MQQVTLAEAREIFGLEVQDEPKTILVWAFEDAPREYRDLSPHAGDEDWVAFVPDALAAMPIDWLGDGTPFGRCEVSRHPVAGGTVHIGAHA